MSKKVCEAINEIDKLFNVEKDGSNTNIIYDALLKAYCPIPKNLYNQECVHYEAIVSSAFIALLTLFKNLDYDGDEDVLEDDKLAEYAILWLCYKIKQKLHSFSNLSEFYNEYIINNEKYFVEENGADAYNSYKDIINKKQDMMNMGISDASKLYEPFKSLCDMYTECNKNNQNCTKCLKDAEDFVNELNKLNEDPNHTVGSSYGQILSTLSKDYEILKNKCTSFPSLPQLTPQKRTVQNFAHNSDVTTSGSSIASTLIPVLLTFTIPFFLGIAYKYSLFGFDNRLHRQYLREKLKKINKKMASYV